MARSRELRVTISGDPSSLNRAFAKAGASAQAFEGRVGKASNSIGHNLATAAKIGSAAIGVGLVGALKGSIDAFAEAERVSAQTNAVLKSTGGAANLTAKQISDLATAVSKKSGMDDEAIQSGENLLLTFTKLRDEQGKGNDIFSQATKVMADMSTALGQDTKSSAIQLGKALNDPIKGVTALQRVGVSFTKSQRDQIKALVDSGKTMDAQKLILKELNTEFGGAAEAAGNTFSGKINKAKVAVGNLGEAIGGPLADAIGTGADKLAGFVDTLSTSDRPAKFFAGLKGHVDDAKALFSNLFDDISKRRDQGASLGSAIGDSFVTAVSGIDWSKVGGTIREGFSKALGGIKVAASFSGDFANSISQGITQAVSKVNGRQVLGKLVDVIGEALDALFSPSFWIEHFRSIFSIVTFVIPVGKILRIPGFATLYRFISAPIFRAVGAVGRGLLDLLGRAGSRAFTSFLAELEKSFPRIANAMLRLATGGANALRSFPARVRAWAARAVGSLADQLGDAVGRVAGVMGRVVGTGVSRLSTGIALFARAAGRIVTAILGRFDDLAGNVPSKIARALAQGTAKIGSWVGNFANAAVKIGRALVDGIVRGVKSTIGKVAGAITGAIGGLVSKINPFGDGLGKKIGAGMPSTPNLAGVPSSGLMGANSALQPFAGIGSKFGLRVSSGKRAAGGRTASGGISYHGSGEAIDMADGRGPDQQKLGFFRYMKSNFGSRLAELIYTPGGAGIKDGHPFTYTGAVAADHYDHVHVALDLGRSGPGIGDGPGKGALATINAAAHAAGIDPAILYGVWGQESGFSMGPGPTSPAGAQGPFQFMPATARSLGVNPHDFRSAAYGAARYLSQFKGRGTAGMLAAYNAGPGARAPYPRETQNYIPSVIRISHRWPGVGGSGASRPGASAGSAGTGSASHPAVDTTSPYDLAIAGSDVDIAEAQQGGVRRGPGGRVVSSPGLREAQAQSNRLGIVNRRITKIRKALKKHLTPATRLRLRQELAQLYGERSSIQGRIAELYTAADSAGAATTGGADGGTGAGGEDQANQALIDAIQANTEAQQVAAQAAQEQAQRLADVHSELKRQTDFATSVSSTDNFQLKKALADYVSGMIGGYGVAPRAFTPGSAVAYRY